MEIVSGESLLRLRDMQGKYVFRKISAEESFIEESYEKGNIDFESYSELTKNIEVEKMKSELAKQQNLMSVFLQLNKNETQAVKKINWIKNRLQTMFVLKNWFEKTPCKLKMMEAKRKFKLESYKLSDCQKLINDEVLSRA